MSLDIVLTKTDFEQIDWQEIIDTAITKKCYSYKKIFDSKIIEAMEQDNPKKVFIFSLLGSIFSMRMTNPSSINPFPNMLSSRYPQNTMLENISDSHLEVLKEVLPIITDPEMKARIAEVIWIRKKEIQIAEIAVDAYIHSFENLFDSISWTTCFERIERAFFLAKKSGKNKPSYLKVVDTIEKSIQRCNGEDGSYLSVKLMDILINHKLMANIEKFITLTKKAAIRAESRKNWEIARAYWECSARWFKLKKEFDSSRESLCFKAETYVKQAEEALQISHPSYMMATVHLQKAMDSLKNIEQTGERIKEIHQILLPLQEKAMMEMINLPALVVPKESISNTINLVKDKSFTDKISILSTYCSSLKIDILKDLAKKDAESLLAKFLPDVMLSETGKTTGKQPNSENPKDAETFLCNSMYQTAKDYQIVMATTFIDPIRVQILLEHPTVEISAILPLVQNNSFIPKGREEIYAKGLYAGLVGDFVISTHLLIPQLEHSIRYLLNQNGIITSDHKSNGIQEEKGLGSLLYMDELSELLTKDVTFDLQGLLVESFGSNLRHKTAHGLIDSHSFNSTSPLYLWWMVLQLCYNFKIISLKKENDTT